MQHFKLKYDPRFELGDFTKPDAGDAGLADALVFGSVIFPPDGSFSAAFFSVDGRTGDPLEAVDVFRVWTALTAEVIANPDTFRHHREAARHAMAAIRIALGIDPAVAAQLDALTQAAQLDGQYDPPKEPT